MNEAARRPEASLLTACLSSLAAQHPRVAIFDVPVLLHGEGTSAWPAVLHSDSQ